MCVIGSGSDVSGWAVLADAKIPDPDTVSPGLAGAVTMILLALATVVLIRSMVGHMRKVRYGPGPPGDVRAVPAAAEAPAAEAPAQALTVDHPTPPPADS